MLSKSKDPLVGKRDQCENVKEEVQLMLTLFYFLCPLITAQSSQVNAVYIKSDG